jgi:heme/copper-type cytochrome/quinol oxidase subunit 2
MSNTKKIIRVIAAVVIVLVVVAVIAVVWYRHTQSQHSATSGTAGSAAVGLDASATSTATSSTRTAVPADVVVPDKGASSTAANVAVPVVQAAGDPSGDVGYRSFNITIKGGAYSPDTVIVNQGDTVNLELTAADAAYGFEQPDYGFNAAIPKGKTQTIQFQALQAGNFIFYCASCGGPSKGPVGHVIVVAK